MLMEQLRQRSKREPPEVAAAWSSIGDDVYSLGQDAWRTPRQQQPNIQSFSTIGSCDGDYVDDGRWSGFIHDLSKVNKHSCGQYEPKQCKLQGCSGATRISIQAELSIDLQDLETGF
ncbi:MAG: hypothetical protein FRX49_11969 [Trebouxia sp. A1-2]|nr:MAG: hypothetical protein FRX49_11969 [Trebouxia sp. A1-2]